MPKLAYNNRQYYAQVHETYPTIRRFQTTTTNPQTYTKAKKIKKSQKPNIFQQLISVIFFSLIAVFILPLGFNKITKTIFHGSQYPKVKVNYHNLRFPTSNYLSNDLLFNEKYLTQAQTKNPQMLEIPATYEMTSLENNLKYLMSKYPSIQPSIYVWQYNTEKFVNINGSKIYSAASIIKIPVLVELFRSIEKKQLALTDTMNLVDYYRAEGSGSLQYKAENSSWTIDDLARIMITESDNSATNMIMSQLGSMTDVNSAIRQWGLHNTHIQTWLPDLNGTNYTTAQDIATMLYNIDNNSEFLSIKSREKIFNYMSHVKNNRLIQAGISPQASFMHKTGDIGKMLGDAGIVHTPNGKQYIVVILANRPHNSVLGKDFIVKASETIYNYMINQ